MRKEEKKGKIIKADIVENIYSKTSPYAKEKITKIDVQDIVESFLEEVKRGLIAGKTIELRGFGTFENRTRKAKLNARNPKTGELVSVEDHNVVAFRSGRDLKNLVWGNK